MGREDDRDRSGFPFGDEAQTPFDATRFESRLRDLDATASFSFPDEQVPADFGRSAVLLPFWREGDEVAVLMTRRAMSLRGHPGMMSFPGGRLEADETWAEAALRETEEEVGIPREAVEVLGRLDDAWSGSRHWLVPIVGWLSAPPAVHPNPAEVDSVHTPLVSTLIRRQSWSREGIDLDGYVHYDATIEWGDECVYGLSADLLVEALLRGLGRPALNGPRRLESLRAWLRTLPDPGA